MSEIRIQNLPLFGTNFVHNAVYWSRGRWGHQMGRSSYCHCLIFNAHKVKVASEVILHLTEIMHPSLEEQMMTPNILPTYHYISEIVYY